MDNLLLYKILVGLGPLRTASSPPPSRLPQLIGTNLLQDNSAQLIRHGENWQAAEGRAEWVGGDQRSSGQGLPTRGRAGRVSEQVGRAQNGSGNGWRLPIFTPSAAATSYGPFRVWVFWQWQRCLGR